MRDVIAGVVVGVVAVPLALAFAIASGVEVYEVNGPFFFGVAGKLKDVLSEIDRPPRVFILRMRHVPAIDATGRHALEQMAKKCRHQRITMILCEVGARPLDTIVRAGKLDVLGGRDALAKTLEMALSYADDIIANEPTLRVARGRSESLPK